MTLPLKTVVFGLITALVLSLVGIVLLAFFGLGIPEVLGQVCVGCLGALAGVLVRTSD